MRTDKKLLELAAKAAGLHHPDGIDGLTNKLGFQWNPLEDDGDALRLAVKLKLDVTFGDGYYFDEGPMTFCGRRWDSGETTWFKRFAKHGTNPMEATRRAIVRAAAEIGKAMP